MPDRIRVSGGDAKLAPIMQSIKAGYPRIPYKIFSFLLMAGLPLPAINIFWGRGKRNLGQGEDRFRFSVIQE